MKWMDSIREKFWGKRAETPQEKQEKAGSPLDLCSAEGCNQRADMIIPTRRGDWPLCFFHSGELDKEETVKVSNEEAGKIVELSPKTDPALVAIHDMLTKKPEPTGDPGICYSDDCDNSVGIEAHEVRGGNFYLCEYHSQHPERLHFPKPEEEEASE